MWKKLSILYLTIATAVVALAGAAVLTVLATWEQPHSASGELNTATSLDDVLEICKPPVPPLPLPGSACGPDDPPGGDEFIFEATENMRPGDVVWQKLRLRNIGAEAWDVASVMPLWTKLSGPACLLFPEGVVWSVPGVISPDMRAPIPVNSPGITILGRADPAMPPLFSDPAGGTPYSDPVNDNHPIPPGAGFTQAITPPGLPPSTAIHVEPGDYEDVLLGVRLPSTAPPACVNTSWSVNMQWDVVRGG